MMTMFLSVFDGIANTVTDYVETYIDLVADFIKAQEWYLQVVLVVVGGLIIILGTFSLIKKLTKILIVIAILVGLFLVYQNLF